MNAIDRAVIQRSLSPARLSTYERTCKTGATNPLELYVWNARISASLLLPLHFCEVSTRNAVSEVLTRAYEERWPWNSACERSLPSKGYSSPRDELIKVREKFSSTGQVIPELKFVFWQKMFTARYDDQLWGPHLRVIFPAAPEELSNSEIRLKLHDQLEQVRKLRNRIAHHEPIFQRDLASDYQAIELLIRWRCPQTADWMHHHQQVTCILAQDPRVSTAQSTNSPKKYIRSTRLQKQQPDLRQRSRINRDKQ
jgi:hypothetical protein